MKGKSFIAGVFTGCICGGAYALFSTPKSGKELRKLIQEDYSTIVSTSTDIVNSMHEWKTDITPVVVKLTKSLNELKKAMVELEKRRSLAQTRQALEDRQ